MDAFGSQTHSRPSFGRLSIGLKQFYCWRYEIRMRQVRSVLGPILHAGFLAHHLNVFFCGHQMHAKIVKDKFYDLDHRISDIKNFSTVFFTNWNLVTSNLPKFGFRRLINPVLGVSNCLFHSGCNTRSPEDLRPWGHFEGWNRPMEGLPLYQHRVSMFHFCLHHVLGRLFHWQGIGKLNCWLFNAKNAVGLIGKVPEISKCVNESKSSSSL